MTQIATYTAWGTYHFRYVSGHSLLYLDDSRAGRFGTKGLALTFVSNATDMEILDKIQARFEVAITDMPGELDKNSYSMSISPLFPHNYFAEAFLPFSDCLNANPPIRFELQEDLVPLPLVICTVSLLPCHSHHTSSAHSTVHPLNPM